ncbi:uncharacterized protein FIBRA_09120 [Fibroporia radiculosa]|uniref:Uncharacterized protein n=1 Tax=Fibroporia radiculosa TaxID=599839 RepID=J4GIX8_9APHY|nr:uncharacterized protein FIBRA_09120 [Fibroporia radiculosa]CCM06818.1 predicted protein [Fibroporia radiculosa]
MPTILPNAEPAGDTISIGHILSYLEGLALAAHVHPLVIINLPTNPVFQHCQLMTVLPQHLKKASLQPSPCNNPWDPDTTEFLSTQDEVATEVLWVQLKAIEDKALLEESVA